MDERYLSLKQVTEKYPFTEGAIRKLLFNRSSNGLDQSITKIGRKIIFNRERFEQWIEQSFRSNSITNKCTK